MAIEPEAKRRAHQWREEVYSAQPERDAPFETISGQPIEPLYDAESLAGWDADRELGFPGEYPYTRGVYPSMYRGRLWTMRQFAGFGTAEETNERFRYLLDHGQTGLSTAFDMPTLMGLDSSDGRSRGEVGVEGVAIDTLDDVIDLFAGIPLDRVTTSMTINAPAAILLAFYVCAAEEQGIRPEALGGTIQTDILKEYIAQKEWCFPIDPAMRLVTDMVEWCAERMPRWHPISISGYHIREAGSTAQQELAFTLKDGFTYVEEAVARGLDVDDFAPRLSFFFNAHIDFFEEIAKYRAARRIWAREMSETYGAKRPESLRMRFHTQTAGVSLTAQQPLLNIVRTAIEALAGVLGGTQSLHTNSYDEALALPTEEAVRIALRTQQVIAHETGVTNTIDPLGGSYFVESLTDAMERAAYEYFARIDELGGMVEAIKRGFPQREIADASFRYQQEVDSRRRIVVGVNDYRLESEEGIDLHRPDPAIERKQGDRLQRTRAARDSAAVEGALADLKAAAAREGENLMPHFLDAARARASEGEMIAALQEVFGRYTEQPVF
jgi:methylmalonyl-CoA mutase, N-terminal domain